MSGSSKAEMSAFPASAGMHGPLTLSRIPRDEALPGYDDLTAGRLLDTARTHLEFR